MKRIILNLCTLTLISCSGVNMLGPKRNVADKGEAEKLYTQNFLQKINLAKEQYKKGKVDLALKELNSIKDAELNETEKGSKKNLLGVMNFAKKNYSVAIKDFEDAKNLAKEDPFLESQIHLNLGSAYYKSNQNEKAFANLSEVDHKNLQGNEAKKFHQLYAVLAEQLGKKDQSLTAKIRALSEIKNLADVEKDEKYLNVKEEFKSLTNTEQVRLLESFDEEKNMAVPALVFSEIEKLQSLQSKDKVLDLTNWLEKRYGDNSEVVEKIKLINGQSEAKSNKLNQKLIGVILPLSGERKALGERALNGIDVALLEVNTDPQNEIKIEVKDNQSNSAIGALLVNELIEKNEVMAIVGGLIPNSATKEYLEAKKNGVLFISLSPVYLPKEEKNNLLIEMPGSIESQLNEVFSDKNLNKMGRRPAIIYPKNEMGEAYVNEFWRRSKKLNLDVTGLISYDKNATDFKDPVKNFLGIKYSREREEEAQIVNDISSLEKNKNIKRLQNLQPQIDFDWIFVPGLPREVVQVLPNFNYFDAFNLNYIGVPSWRSELMTNEGYRYGNVYFVDENLSLNETSFTKNFNDKFGRPPKLVETIAFDAVKILSDLSNEEKNLNTRSDLEVFLMKKMQINGESGTWKLTENIWLKDLATFKIKREGIDSF